MAEHMTYALVTYSAPSVVVGLFTVTLSGDDRLGAAAGKTIELVGTANLPMRSIISWICTNGSIDHAYLPERCVRK
jgi:hypothetical protein